MSVAEYIAAFVSIIIGLALADLVTSLQRLLRAGRRVSWDWLTPMAALLTMAFVINVWWTMYGSLLRLDRISVAAFVPDLISLLLLFSIASSALPDEVPAEGLVLSRFYEDNRRWFWRLFALYTLWVTVVNGVRAASGGASAGTLAGVTVPNLVLATLMVVLASTPRRRIHYAIVALLLVVTALAWLPQEVIQRTAAPG